MTKLEVLTLPYDPVRQVLHDEALNELQQRAEVISQESYLVGPPHALILLLTTRPLEASSPSRGRHSATYIPQRSLSGAHDKASPKTRGARRKRLEDLDAAKRALSAEELQAFEGLRLWRNEEATRLGVPSFELCSNQALIELVTRKPQTLTALRAIRGFGEKRVKRFGEAILAQLSAQRLTSTSAQGVTHTGGSQ